MLIRIASRFSKIDPRCCLDDPILVITKSFLLPLPLQKIEAFRRPEASCSGADIHRLEKSELFVRKKFEFCVDILVVADQQSMRNCQATFRESLFFFFSLFLFLSISFSFFFLPIIFLLYFISLSFTPWLFFPLSLSFLLRSYSRNSLLLYISYKFSFYLYFCFLDYFYFFLSLALIVSVLFE